MFESFFESYLFSSSILLSFFTASSSLALQLWFNRQASSYTFLIFYSTMLLFIMLIYASFSKCSNLSLAIISSLLNLFNASLSAFICLYSYSFYTLKKEAYSSRRFKCWFTADSSLSSSRISIFILLFSSTKALQSLL